MCLLDDNSIWGSCQKIDSAVNQIYDIGCKADTIGFFVMFMMRGGENACGSESDCGDSGDFNDGFHNIFLSFGGYYVFLFQLLKILAF